VRPYRAEDVWTLHLVAAGAGPDAAMRVKRALKCLLRGFGLRCLKVRAPTPEELAELFREEDGDATPAQAQTNPQGAAATAPHRR
jgi:hypothetical protein